MPSSRVTKHPHFHSVGVDGVPVFSSKSSVAHYEKGNIALVSSQGPVEFLNLRVLSNGKSDVESAASDVPIDVVTNEIPHTGDTVQVKDRSTSSSLVAATMSNSKDQFQCFTYDPLVPHLGSWTESERGRWKMYTPNPDEGGKGHQVRSPGLVPRFDVSVSDEMQFLLLKGWSCRISKFAASLTFLSEGEAGIIFRYHNATEHSVVLLETLTQKIQLMSQSPKGRSVVKQVLSPVPIVARTSVDLTLIDSVPHVEVRINGYPAMDGVLEDSAGPSGLTNPYQGGIAVTRGTIAFSRLDMSSE
eukprot:Gregarina_sp_Poly_1__1637@NODE_1417_length_4193_cov_22_636452_g944_i0_p1_GENE_NODE_1417_length_4193_cov_22_636452_g944_i0NODE_1417_length_4193_cov_22_636452_g944_i0_p1_ORF_typecomplete_len302_score35_34DUF1080/PF06439_11/1_1DUF1080/PF06439_11/3_4e02_NODE_1417_length_4193_cov_22_636452_g944_i018352740